MDKNKKYEYCKHLLSGEPYKPVQINYKSFISQLFCKHNYQYLVKTVKGDMFVCISGDIIEEICPKCGKSKGTMFWEHEGMGYK